MVTVKERCWAPTPELPLSAEEWPDPEEDGRTIFEPEIMSKLALTFKILTNYIEEQNAACPKEAE